MRSSCQLSLQQQLLLGVASLAWTVNGASNIVGCNAVDCPTSDNTTASTCQVAGTHLELVGVSAYATDNRNLAWTVGITTSDANPGSLDTNRTVQRSFYLGSDASMQSDQQTACAFFMSRTSNNDPVYYETSYDDSRDKSSQCTLLPGGSSCASALKARASTAAAATNSTCTSIAHDLQSMVPQECGPLSRQDLRVRGVSLKNRNAINSRQNGTSNCWPTLPKSNELTFVTALNTSATVFVNSTSRAFFGTTPVMTVFAGNGSDRNPEVDLLCLHPIDITQKGVDTQDTGDAMKLIGNPALALASLTLLAAFFL